MYSVLWIFVAFCRVFIDLSTIERGRKHEVTLTVFRLLHAVYKKNNRKYPTQYRKLLNRTHKATIIAAAAYPLCEIRPDLIFFLLVEFERFVVWIYFARIYNLAPDRTPEYIYRKKKKKPSSPSCSNPVRYEIYQPRGRRLLLRITIVQYIIFTLFML